MAQSDVVIRNDGDLFDSKGPCRCGANAFWLPLPEGHQLATKKSTYWTDLRNETVLLSQYDPGRELEDLFDGRSLISTADRPKIERHDVSRGIIKTLISIGSGCQSGGRVRHRRHFCGPHLSRGTRRHGAEPGSIIQHIGARTTTIRRCANFLKLLSERYPLPCAG